MTYNYVSYIQAVEKHDEIIEKSGGAKGVKSKVSLQSVLTAIQDDGFYPDFFDKLAFLMFALNKNHPFIDGNKRSSIAVAAYFLEINFIDQVFIDMTIRESENLALLVAQNYMDRDLLHKVLRDLVTDGEMSEETKIAYAGIVDLIDGGDA